MKDSGAHASIRGVVDATSKRHCPTTGSNDKGPNAFCCDLSRNLPKELTDGSAVKINDSKIDLMRSFEPVLALGSPRRRQLLNPLILLDKAARLTLVNC